MSICLASNQLKLGSQRLLEVKSLKNVGKVHFGYGSYAKLAEILEARRRVSSSSFCVFIVDHYFERRESFCLPATSNDVIFFVDTSVEPSTNSVDELVEKVVRMSGDVCAVIGIGGGSALDTAKAVSNLLANGGRAADYQGWDLLKCPGVYKLGIPTLSGTGAEATRTCVLMNYDKGIKLGMNSDFSMFDELILDHEFSATVPADQYFYSGMDTYIHCIESINGSYRNALGDSFSKQALGLVRSVFRSGDMMSAAEREKLMLASYFGGAAVAASFVGVVHPFSAGLSVVLGIHHCEANCIALRGLREFYPEEVEELDAMAEINNITIRSGVCSSLSDVEFDRLYDATIVHHKPLENALGPDFGNILTQDRVIRLFGDM